MLSSAVQPPTTEHVYAQWKEREEFSAGAPLGPQDDSEHTLDVKGEETLHLMSGGPISQNHFRTSRIVRLKGTTVKEQDENLANSSVYSFESFVSCLQGKGADFQKRILTLDGVMMMMRDSALCAKNTET